MYRLKDFDICNITAIVNMNHYMTALRPGHIGTHYFIATQFHSQICENQIYIGLPSPVLFWMESPTPWKKEKQFLVEGATLADV